MELQFNPKVDWIYIVALLVGSAYAAAKFIEYISQA